MKNHFPFFDWLRLVLALEVLYVHIAHSYSELSLPFNIQSFLPPVALFVMISGFLIPGSFSSSKNWRHFMWKRILRIGPAFLVSLGLVLSLWGPGMIAPVLVTYLTLGFVSSGVNGPLWSLGLEEVLYVFHSASRKVLPWREILCQWCLIVSFVIWMCVKCWIGWLAFNPGCPPDQYFAPIFAFFLGNVLSFHKVGILSSIPKLPKIPDFSYGIYIYHFPILMLVDKKLHLFWVEGAFITVVGTLLMSVVSWYFVESKALKLKEWFVSSHNWS